MSVWVDVDGHLVQLVENGRIVWEHDTIAPYRVSRHMVSSKDGARWDVVSADPLTLTPSLHCDRTLGGCGRHGFVADGHWLGV